MQRKSWLLVGSVLVLLVLAACGGKTQTPAPPEQQGQLGPFDWDRNPDAIIVRLDARVIDGPPYVDLNSIPPCTLWGDGRVVWSTTNADGSETILEGRIDEETMRGFLEDIINRGFYTWEDELVPPNYEEPVLESVTVMLYGQAHTVRRYTSWPQNGYIRILENCQQLSDAPVLVEPTAGWVSAYPTTIDPEAPSWPWWENAPFTLHELAANKEARWLEGPLATEIWRTAREGRDDIQVWERNPNGGGFDAFYVAIVVPGYSRDATLTSP